ncbi:hypothetical protein RSAG8_12556, partial [Rhizoctonia solani AG-8 WAC10335]
MWKLTRQVSEWPTDANGFCGCDFGPSEPMLTIWPTSLSSVCAVPTGASHCRISIWPHT